MSFILKELIRAFAYVSLLTLALYFFVDDTLSAALTVALASQVLIFTFNFKRIMTGCKASKK
jgi:hypothetical protein